MPRHYKNKPMHRFSFDRNDRILGIFALIVLGIGVGVSGFQFNVFADTDWGIDVELVSIGYGTNMYQIEDLPDTATIYLAGTRATTIDYDKEINWGTVARETLNILGGSYTAYKATPTSAGLLPTVTHAVGNLFFSTANGSTTTAPKPVFENTTEGIGNVHFYFGFSVMFTTRADVYVGTGSTLITNREVGELGWLTYRQVAPYSEIDAKSVVGLNLNSLTDTFDYQGVINTVNVVNQRARYTLSEDISGVSSSLDVFNAEYEWLPHNMQGYALESAIPVIKYNVIDTTKNKLATIELGAKLAIGMDSPVDLPWNLEDMYASDVALYMLNAALNPLGYDTAGSIHVYNVEYIYDLVIDVSLNGVPVADYMAEFAQGTSDAMMPADEQSDDEFPIFIVIAIAIIVIIVLRRLMG